MKPRAIRLVAMLTLMLGAASCSRAIRPTQPHPLTPPQIAEFWVDVPVETRDVFIGPGSRAAAPRLNGVYTLLKGGSPGFSTKYDVKDEFGTKWSAKVGPESQAEVVASRLVWAMGYHQLPQYLVGRWTLKGGEMAGLQTAGRMRPTLRAYKNVGDWSWHENPFVGTQPYKGLLVLMVMLNNSDMKPEQNRIYEVSDRDERRRRIYVVSDLGLSFGESGIDNPKRGDIDAFEAHGFIKRIEGTSVVFDQKNLRAELFDQITPADLRWMSARLSRLSDSQWREAFRAGGWEGEIADRFIRRMKQKFQQGLQGKADAN